MIRCKLSAFLYYTRNLFVLYMYSEDKFAWVEGHITDTTKLILELPNHATRRVYLHLAIMHPLPILNKPCITCAMAAEGDWICHHQQEKCFADKSISR